MSHQSPGDCRSLGCTDRAEYHAEMMSSYKHEAWDGEFCRLHLVRCLELKILELNRNKYLLVIEPIEMLNGGEFHRKRRNKIARILQMRG